MSSAPDVAAASTRKPLAASPTSSRSVPMPSGGGIFDTKAPKFGYTIEKGKTATFKYRVVLFDHAADTAEMNQEADAFAAMK